MKDLKKLELQKNLYVIKRKMPVWINIQAFIALTCTQTRRPHEPIFR